MGVEKNLFGVRFNWFGVNSTYLGVPLNFLLFLVKNLFYFGWFFLNFFGERFYFLVKKKIINFGVRFIIIHSKILFSQTKKKKERKKQNRETKWERERECSLVPHFLVGWCLGCACRRRLGCLRCLWRWRRRLLGLWRHGGRRVPVFVIDGRRSTTTTLIRRIWIAAVICRRRIAASAAAAFSIRTIISVSIVRVVVRIVIARRIEAGVLRSAGGLIRPIVLVVSIATTTVTVTVTVGITVTIVLSRIIRVGAIVGGVRVAERPFLLLSLSLSLFVGDGVDGRRLVVPILFVRASSATLTSGRRCIVGRVLGRACRLIGRRGAASIGRVLRRPRRIIGARGVGRRCRRRRRRRRHSGQQRWWRHVGRVLWSAGRVVGGRRLLLHWKCGFSNTGSVRGGGGGRRRRVPVLVVDGRRDASRARLGRGITVVVAAVVVVIGIGLVSCPVLSRCRVGDLVGGRSGRRRSGGDLVPFGGVTRCFGGAEAVLAARRYRCCVCGRRQRRCCCCLAISKKKTKKNTHKLLS